MQIPSGLLIHTVLISFRVNTPEHVRREVHTAYQTLGEECGGARAGIVYWRVDWNLDTRKGVHVVEVVIFRDNEALQAFRSHPAHTRVTNVLSEHADWVVGDIHS